jgi:hypothetical protein
MGLAKWDGKARRGLIWLRIRANGRETLGSLQFLNIVATL